MRAEVAIPNVIVSELDKKIQFVKQKHLTGILAIESDMIHQWRLYFLAGQLVWANTRTHAKRRWCRQLLQHRPELLKNGLSAYPADWTYSRLARLVICKKFNRQVFSHIVSGCISEALFDLQQQGTLSFQQTGKGLKYRIKSQKACDFSYINLQTIGIWAQAKHRWHQWEEAGLTAIGPNDALVIQDLASLEDLASPRLFKLLSALANRQQTLRDIALKANQPLQPFVMSILPHIHNQSLRLKSVEDKIPRSVIAHQEDVVFKIAQAIIPKDARIVYVDDSLANSQTMATIVEAAGFRYSNISDPLEVLKQLVKLKPKVIFLQLTMPVVNGYELCAQIRRISGFKDTPIVMVGSENSLAERMRAKMVGASEFVSKPIKPKNVLKSLIELNMI
ncbi:response regulator [Leptolyngbyaceae cyanobacterium CCMR0082]|uniref:Response regulator n=2 Tax=Adonisia turfae TaxID=2950184 RepID=A0A6M0SI42_9CYAN|nr:response regulator [Adonisia turfae]MDV3353186.1 response regulator [Leptothoe sp. LEGE 181152]NEZ57308.1 response regulator [Adonisia turfae CCMR0081]NEZ68177.1 response regulator [Adonisia turfae CCMR0082]